MITIGDNPQGDSDLNKFMSGCEGLRGKLIAIHNSKRKGIVLSCNDSIKAFTKEELKQMQQDKNLSDELLKNWLDSTDLKVEWGKMYLIVEGNKETYPVAVKEVSNIPKDHEWEIVFNQEEKHD